MKLQHLAVIFIIIIVPISITLSTYISSEVNAIVLQNSYNNKLFDSTYDMVKAFQLNTVHNKFSTIADSKIRDIEAAVATFYNTLGSNLGSSGYSSETIKQFTPALVFNLYDGYYIYSKYDNWNSNNVNNPRYYKDDKAKGVTQYGLKPFIYYSARYVTNDVDIVVNYTLDNYVSIYGTIDKLTSTQAYVRSGYLIDTAKISNKTENSIKYDGVTFNKGEELKEYLVVLNGDSIDETATGEYNYIVYNSQKYYVDWDNGNKRI